MTTQQIEPSDPWMPLFDGATYFYQQHDDHEAWQASVGADLQVMLASNTPPFMRTVAGIVDEFNEAGGNRYLGPVYADWDGDNIAEVIPSVQKFAAKIKDKGVDINSVRWYATGGKGFHAEIPLGTVFEKVPADGVVNLPYVLKEMMYDLATEHLDFRVYSARKGRMWRVPNVKRSTGRYKVPVSVAELMAMTPESYATLTSAPREFSPLAPAKFSPVMGVLFSVARGRVEVNAKKRKASASSGDLRRFLGDKFPPSIQALADGKLPSRAGWNLTAMQLAILAHAVGISEDELIKRCAALIRNHDGDGHRYRTKAAREAELRTQFRHAHSYDFSVGGLLSILPNGSHRDLRMLGRAVK